MRNTPYLIALFSALFMTACTSSHLSPATPSSAEKEKAKHQAQELEKMQADIKNLSQDIVQLRYILQSQEEKSLSLQKDIEILNRGIRSGVYEDLSPKMQLSIPQTPEPTLPPAAFATGTLQTDLGLKPQEHNAPLFKVDNKKTERELLSDADIKVQRKNYNGALDDLYILQRDYPNTQQKIRILSLSAEAWLGLKEYQHALSHVQEFYLSFPDHPNMIKMKLIEGLCYEGMGAKEKAAAIFAEIIGIDPQSMIAKVALRHLEKLKNN